MRLLVVEDQKDLNDIIVRKLKREGYAVDRCFDGNTALDYINSADYDGILLDILLPGVTGLGVLSEMRGRGNSTPVLLLTALGDVEDRVAGLDAGADDYLVKPFDFEELLARIRSITRRGGAHASSIMEHKGITIDTASHSVRRAGEELELTAKEYNILLYLMHNIGRVISRDNLSSHVWNYDYDGGSNVIDVYVHHLRKKLENSGDGRKFDRVIETIKGTGYIIR
ncbi:MAG: response regulator transcription factor [Mogibacterium sp.]|nr:response regulator transcription factor [Mogibacterium sp.]